MSCILITVSVYVAIMENSDYNVDTLEGDSAVLAMLRYYHDHKPIHTNTVLVNVYKWGSDKTYTYQSILEYAGAWKTDTVKCIWVGTKVDVSNIVMIVIYSPMCSSECISNDITVVQNTLDPDSILTLRIPTYTASVCETELNPSFSPKLVNDVGLYTGDRFFQTNFYSAAPFSSAVYLMPHTWSLEPDKDDPSLLRLTNGDEFVNILLMLRFPTADRRVLCTENVRYFGVCVETDSIDIKKSITTAADMDELIWFETTQAVFVFGKNKDNLTESLLNNWHPYVVRLSKSEHDLISRHLFDHERNSVGFLIGDQYEVIAGNIGVEGQSGCVCGRCFDGRGSRWRLVSKNYAIGMDMLYIESEKFTTDYVPPGSVIAYFDHHILEYKKTNNEISDFISAFTASPLDFLRRSMSPENVSYIKEHMCTVATLNNKYGRQNWPAFDSELGCHAFIPGTPLCTAEEYMNSWSEWFDDRIDPVVSMTPVSDIGEFTMDHYDIDSSESEISMS